MIGGAPGGMGGPKNLGRPGNFGPGPGSGSYDSPNRAMQPGDPMSYGAAAQMFNPLQQNLILRAGMYQGGTNAIKLAQMRGQGVGSQQMFMPQQPQAPAPQMKPLQMAFMPGANLATGGKYGISQFRPGYNFVGPGA